MAKTVEELLASLQEILDGATDRPLTDEEVRSYETLEQELGTVRTDLELRARHQAYVTPTTGQIPNEGPQTASGTRDDEADLERAFTDYMKTGVENADIQELRAQSIGTNSAGGFTVPTGWRNKIVDRMKAFGGIANAVETITTDTGNTLPWLTVDDTANVGAIVAEGATFASGADLTFGQATLGSYSYTVGGAGTAPLKVSFELLQDTAVDLENFIGNKLGERIARLQSTHIVTGTGSGQPQGIVTGLTPVQTGQNTGLKYDDLVNYIHAVDPAYRPGSVWGFNDLTLAVVEKMKNAAGDPIWADATTEQAALGIAGNLKGYPVVIDQAFANYAPASATQIYGVFGNLKEGFVIRRVKEIEVIANPWGSVSNRQMEYSAWARMDAKQQNTNAYVALTGKV